MLFKVASFLAVAVFMFQPHEVMPQYSPDPVINSLITNFVTAANTTLQSTLTQTAMVANQFYTQLKAFEYQVQSNVSSILAQVDKQIEAQVLKTGGLVSKIYNCTKLQKTKLDAYANNTFHNITGCATEKIVQGINSVNNIFTALSKMYVAVFNATNRINASCPAPKAFDFGAMFNNFVCVSTITTAINVELAGYAITVSTNSVLIAALIAAIPNFPVEFAACISARTATALINITPIIGEIALCTLF